MFLWGGFKIPTPGTLENLENIQKNLFSVVLIPNWKFLCRYFTGNDQKRKDTLRFQNFPEIFTNVCPFLLRYNSNDMIFKLFFNVLSKVTPSIFFKFKLRIAVSDISKLNASVVLRSKWHLLRFAFILFGANHVNNFWVIAFSLDTTSLALLPIT